MHILIHQLKLGFLFTWCSQKNQRWRRLTVTWLLWCMQDEFSTQAKRQWIYITQTLKKVSRDQVSTIS